MFNTDKMYTFMMGYVNGAGFVESQKALTFAKECHKEQKRKDGKPYYVHPLTMACQATAMGINNDQVIAAILLHDVVEDCDISREDLPVSESVKESVGRLTFNPENREFSTVAEKEQAKKQYYEQIKTDPVATLAKIIDRCHNVSSMAGVFSRQKLEGYINETYTYVLPLIRYAKDYYPEYRDQLFLLKYQINSLLDAISAGLNAQE